MTDSFESKINEKFKFGQIMSVSSAADIAKQADQRIAEQQRVIDELKKNLKGVHYLLNRAKFDFITDIKLRDEFQIRYRNLLGENNG